MRNAIDMFCQVVRTDTEKAGMRNLVVVATANIYEKE